MKNKTETFAQVMKRFEYRYDTRTIFNDFLTMTLCSFSQNPATGKSHDEDLYLETIGKYKNDNLRFEFPKLLARLTIEMEERVDSGMGTDVLGDFYESNLSRKGSGQFFTPWPICMFMAKATADSLVEGEQNRPLRILDPTCGSGRMLLAGSKVNGPMQEYFGVDIDETCVKMTAVNLFLNGLFHSEVMCADALARDDFRFSYRTSFLPFGIFRVTDREQSPLWHLMQNSWPERKVKEHKAPPEFSETKAATGNQLTIF
jgi:type I restriction-modification system DNA methylase subunit